MDVRIEEMKTLKVLFARATGPYSLAAKIAWDKMCGWARRSPSDAARQNPL
jgi:DNA gyrase inhibitor GyrI